MTEALKKKLLDWVGVGLIRLLFVISAITMRRMAKNTQANCHRIRRAVGSSDAVVPETVGPLITTAEELAGKYSSISASCLVASVAKNDNLNLDHLKSEMTELGAYQEQVIALTRTVSSRLPTTETPGKASTRIARPPGNFLHRIANLLFSQKVRTRILEPIIADMRHEYFLAYINNDKVSARMAIIRGCVAFLSAVILRIASPLLELILKIFR